MAERPGELDSVDKLDPVSTTAGAGSDEFLDRYSEDLTASEAREFDADGDDAPEETEQIKARIEETRKGMGETIDAIQERLSFSNISEQVSETVSSAIESAKDTAYDATIGKAVNFMRNVGDGVTHSGAFKTMRKNPFPLALIGLGTGLLVYQAYNSGSSSKHGNGRYRRNDEDYGRGNMESNRWSLGSAGASIGDATSRAYDGVTDKASAALEGVSNTASTAYETVSGAVSTAYSRADDVAHKAYERAGEYGQLAHEKYDQYLEENPLALGALAVAVGAAVGFAIPSTRYEGKLMGDAREQLMQRAQDAAGTLVDRAKHVASEAGETIKEETRALTQ